MSSNRLQWFDYAFIPKASDENIFKEILKTFSSLLLSILEDILKFLFQNLELIDLHDNQIEQLGNYYKLKVEYLENNNNSNTAPGPLGMKYGSEIRLKIFLIWAEDD